MSAIRSASLILRVIGLSLYAAAWVCRRRNLFRQAERFANVASVFCIIGLILGVFD